MEATHALYFCIIILLLNWNGCVNSLKCYVCNDCYEIREEYIVTCDFLTTTIEPDNNTVSTTEAGTDQTTTPFEITTEPSQIEDADVTTLSPTTVTQTETTISIESSEVTDQVPVLTQNPDEEDSFFRYMTEMNETSRNYNNEKIIINDYDTEPQIDVIYQSYNPRCIVTTYKENGSDDIITVRGCSFESDDNEARCREGIGLLQVELKSCKLCEKDLCNAAHFVSYHFGLITSTLILFYYDFCFVL